jgi:hypothetical protein
MKKYLVLFKDKKLYGTFEQIMEAENKTIAKNKLIKFCHDENIDLDKTSVEMIEDYYI